MAPAKKPALKPSKAGGDGKSLKDQPSSQRAGKPPSGRASKEGPAPTKKATKKKGASSSSSGAPASDSLASSEHHANGAAELEVETEGADSHVLPMNGADPGTDLETPPPSEPPTSPAEIALTTDLSAPAATTDEAAAAKAAAAAAAKAAAAAEAAEIEALIKSGPPSARRARPDALPPVSLGPANVAAAPPAAEAAAVTTAPAGEAAVKAVDVSESVAAEPPATEAAATEAGATEAAATEALTAEDAPKAEEPKEQEAAEVEEQAPKAEETKAEEEEAPKAEEEAPKPEEEAKAGEEAPKAEEEAPKPEEEAKAEEEAPKAEEEAPKPEEEAKAEEEAPKAEEEGGAKGEEKEASTVVEEEAPGARTDDTPAAAATTTPAAAVGTESAASIVAAAMPVVTSAAEEAATAAEEDEKFADASEAAWNDLEGSPALDELLGAGEGVAPADAPMRLIDARFLCALAKGGGRLVRRQDLPEGAFFDVARLRREGYGSADQSLRMLVAILPWLAVDHPDPSGIQLMRLARVLESFIAEDGGSYAVLVPYCSLHQKGLGGEARSAPEQALYDAALKGLATVYAHEAVPVLEMTALPETLDAQASVAQAFTASGWAYFQMQVATHPVKPPGLLLDMNKFEDPGEGEEAPFLDDVLTQCKARRPPPVMPADFRSAIASKQLPADTSPALVADLYEAFFSERFPTMDALVYDSNGWGDDEIEALCKVLAGAQLGACKQLWLSHNDITDKGMEMLASVLQAGALPLLEQVNVYGNAKASFDSRESIRKAKEDQSPIQVHYDGMGGGRTNHAV